MHQVDVRILRNIHSEKCHLDLVLLKTSGTLLTARQQIDENSYGLCPSEKRSSSTAYSPDSHAVYIKEYLKKNAFSDRENDHI